MIVEYTEDGRIFHILSDPVPAHMAQFLTDNGHTFLELPPTPWPAEQQFDENGNPVMVPAINRETGEPIMTPVLDPDTGSVVVDLVEGPDGEMIEQTRCEPQLEPLWASNGYDSADVDIMRDYVSDSEIVARPVFDVPASIIIHADGVTEATIAGLPSPCAVVIDGVQHEADGEIVITSDMPAEYEIRLVQWPYIETTVKVIAHAPDAE